MSDNNWRVESSSNDEIILKNNTAKGVGAGAGASIVLFIIIAIIKFIIENWIYIVSIIGIIIACVIVCLIINDKYNKPLSRILITILISIGLICSVFYIVPKVKNSSPKKVQSIIIEEPNRTVIEKNKFVFKPKISAVYHGTITTDAQTFDVFLIIVKINRRNQALDSYYMCYIDGVYFGPVELTGHLLNNTLTLYEKMQDSRNLAFMQFNNFNTNDNNITGVWQDLRDIGSAYSFQINLSNLAYTQNNYNNQKYFDNNFIIFFIITGILFIILIFVILIIIRS